MRGMGATPLPVRLLEQLILQVLTTSSLGIAVVIDRANQLNAKLFLDFCLD